MGGEEVQTVRGPGSGRRSPRTKAGFGGRRTRTEGLVARSEPESAKRCRSGNTYLLFNRSIDQPTNQPINQSINSPNSYSTSGGSEKNFEKGAEDNSAPSSFIANAHNKIYAFYTANKISANRGGACLTPPIESATV